MKMSTNRSVIIETIREVQKPYKQYDWYQPYMYYANAAGAGSTFTASNTDLAGTITTNGNSLTSFSANAGGTGLANLQQSSAQEQSFTDIKTF